MQNKSQLTAELITRESQNALLGYIGMLPNPDKVLRNTGKTIEVYRELKNDPHVWSCIQSRKSGLISLEYNVIPNGANEAMVREIEDMLAGLDMQQIERDILEAPLFGYQPMEIIWKITEGGRKYIVPEAIVAKPQEWFFYDGRGNLRYKKSGEPKGEEPPPFKIMNVQYESSYMNPYGHALLGKCYWPVTFKNGSIRFWVNFTEKYGMPILMGQYTRGSTYDETQKLANELANMTEDAVIVAPSDIKLEMHEAVRTSSVSLYKELISHCNAEISKAILSQTLTTELENGSYAAAQTHFKVRREVILSDIRLVESVINTVIRHIINLNFSSIAYPKFELLVNDEDTLQKVERDLKISQTGSVKFTKQYWLNNYGFKEDEIEM
jgi:phage gp29-like protein